MSDDTVRAPATAADRLFAEERRRIEDFNFGKDTAAVFDDMLDRSVPFYAEIQRMVGELAADFAVDGTSIYDLGCSTANTFLAVGARLPCRSATSASSGSIHPRRCSRKAEQKLVSTSFPWPYSICAFRI